MFCIHEVLNKIKIILIRIIFVFILLYTVFFIISDIEPYDETYFTFVENNLTEEEANLMLNQFYDEGFNLQETEGLNEYYKRIETCIKATDFSKEGIICENIWLMGKKDKLSKYAVVYNDRTVRYIMGDFTLFPTFYFKDGDFYEKVTGKKVSTEIADVFYIRGKHEEYTDKLSIFEYFILLNKLKFNNLIPVSNKYFTLEYVADYARGFYYNGKCYSYSEHLRTFIRKIKMKSIWNCDNYINKCLNLDNDTISGKQGKPYQDYIH
ncbi:MAG: hypothetical protein Q4D26_00240 [Clostridia bacterium]|nr:hypothetical protein [Clostridia bacterium]